MRPPLLIFALLLVAPSATAAAAVPRSGDLVITEIAADPALPEPAAEFVVADNVSESTLLLDGLRLTDAAGTARAWCLPTPASSQASAWSSSRRAGASVYGCAPHRALVSGWAPLNNDGDTVAWSAMTAR